MKSRAIGEILKLAGILGATLSFLWWLITFGQILYLMNGDMLTATKCLVANVGSCSTIKLVASQAGYITYEPMFLWGFLVMGLAGFVIENVANDMVKQQSAVRAEATVQSLRSDEASLGSLTSQERTWLIMAISYLIRLNDERSQGQPECVFKFGNI